MAALRLLAVTAHPDDEALGCGGVLAKYASEGRETFLVTADPGQTRGRFEGEPEGAPRHPGRSALARIREAELRASAEALGVRDVAVLDYEDQLLDRAPVDEIVPQLVAHVRRIRPHVVLTFPPDGAYGHPDHVAISQFTTAALVAAADSTFGDGALPTHRVSKLYYLAWSEAAWARLPGRVQEARVGGRRRRAAGRAVARLVDHDASSTRGATGRPCGGPSVATGRRWRGTPPSGTLTDAHHEALWGTQSFYRAFSLVNGGRCREHDLFEGLDAPACRGAGRAAPRVSHSAGAGPMTSTDRRNAPLAMDRDAFRKLGHLLVDELADLMAAVPDGPVTPTSRRRTSGRPWA